MRIFDAQLRSDACSDADLQNLRYFDTEQVVLTAHAPRAFERAEDLLRYFGALVCDEARRVERAGLRAHVALGVLPPARPRRAHPELWAALPGLLRQPRVVALGEVGVWADEKAQWALFERQVKLARDLFDGRRTLATIVTPPEDLRVNMTYKMMQRAERLGMAPGCMLMNRLDERLIETVVSEGFVAGVSVGASNLNPRHAAEAIARALQALGSAERLVLNSAIRIGGADILGIPKTIVALQELGVDPRSIERMVYGNARALFATAADEPAGWRTGADM